MIEQQKAVHSKKKKSGFTKAYLIFRWPIVLGLLLFSGLFFMVGLLNSLGYNGTTELRPVDKNSQEWKNFLNTFSGNPSRGAPFEWKGSQPQVNGNLVTFDKRLVRALGYLRDGSVSKSLTCGWNSKHELMTIDVDSTEFSNYSVPPDKPRPISTIHRGVGLRVSQVDYIKCTEFPKNPSAAYLCKEAPTPKKFPPGDSNGFPIPLSSNDLLRSDEWPYDEANCQVRCAVDYYPLLPDPVASLPPEYNAEVLRLAQFDPKLETADYQDISSFSQKAALLKTVLLSYELMHIDDPGCESSSGNTGYNRAVPVSMITQSWVRDKLKEQGWNKMVTMAEQKFPFGLQRSSKLAALASDPVLNVLGFHWNF